MHASPPLRVLVVDDEPPHRRHLEQLLDRAPDVEVVGTAGDGTAAVAAIAALAPDLVFLDVQMPDLSGIDVVRVVGAADMPVTVFVTAFDRHAVEAFDVAAVDYLVKPFDDERFVRALDRARGAVAAREAGGASARLLASLHGGRGSPAAPVSPYLERIAVEVAGQRRPVPVGEIDLITASGTYAELHVGGRRYFLRVALRSLEERLDPARFMRVHRSTIVRLDRIETLRRLPGGDAELRLRDGAPLRVSRTRREALEQWLGVPRA